MYTFDETFVYENTSIHQTTVNMEGLIVGPIGINASILVVKLYRIKCVIGYNWRMY